MRILFVQPPIEDFYTTAIRLYPLGLLYAPNRKLLFRYDTNSRSGRRISPFDHTGNILPAGRYRQFQRNLRKGPAETQRGLVHPFAQAERR